MTPSPITPTRDRFAEPGADAIAFRFNDEIEAVIEALANRSLYIDPVITHEFPATRALEALAVAGDAARSSKVLVTF